MKIIEEHKKTELFNPEYLEFTKQLKHIQNWFIDYRGNKNSNDESVKNALVEIECAIGSIVGWISEIVAFEFQENAFYKNTLNEK